jgi:CrcB protein
MTQTILLIGFGGFLGAISRFLMGQMIKQMIFIPFPVATLVINVIGSFLIGFVLASLKANAYFPQIILFFVIGFLGSFTTFSAFSFETLELLKRGPLYLALANIALSLILCLIFVYVGDWIGSLISS